jgi:hypothetical protein
MDILRLATATAVTLGLPVLAMIHPADKTPQPAQAALSNQATGEESAPASGAAESTPLVATRHSQTRGTFGQTEVRPAQSPALASFSSEIRRLSDEADSVDRVFAALGAQCGVQASNGVPGFGRAWFAMLDEDRQFSAAHCSELWQLVRQSGQGIRNDLKRVLTQANRAGLDAGTIVGLLRWHSLDAR